jgi:ppGpp synthetase/RelA/SpoT-type nucleotidyltranferase
MGVIEDFVEEYERQYDYWESAAATARRLLEAELNSAGLRAYVTSRAKSVDRLADKLEQRSRARDRPYASVDEIECDIADRAGVRIALYFPGQMEEVEKLVGDVLDVWHTRCFPQKAGSAITGPAAAASSEAVERRRFSGYGARHFRAHIRDTSLSADQARCAKATIEVQVASVLMHAWSEVEHDLVYKPLEGRLSDSEHALLDQLNGLVLAGEIALEQLQAAGDARVNAVAAPFRDHYELGEFLRARLAALGQALTDATLGRVDILFRYLSEEEVASAAAVAPYLEELEQDFERRPVAEQLADLMLSGNQAHCAAYGKAMSATRHPPQAQLRPTSSDTNADAASRSYASFVRAWASLEETLARHLPEAHRGIARQLQAAHAAGLIDSEQLEELNSLRTLRNEVVHSPSVIVSVNRLNVATDTIVAVIDHLERQ